MGWVTELLDESGKRVGWRAFESEGTPPRRVQRSRTRRLKQDAIDAARKAVEVALAGKAVGGPEPFSALASDYFELWTDDLSPTTLHGYRSIYQLHLGPYFCSFVGEDITPTDVLRYRKSKRKELAPNTVDRHMCLLRCILGFGVETKRLEYNAAAAVKSKKRAKPLKTRRALTTAEARTLLAAALVIRDEPDPPKPERVRDRRWLYCLCLLAILGGVRRGEDIALRRSDFDLEPADMPKALRGYSILYLTRNLVQVPGTGKHVKGTKAESEDVRPILLPPVVTEAVKAELRRQAAKKLADPKWNPEGYLFPGRQGGPFHPDFVSHAVSDLMEQCQIPDADLHGLRHTHSTVLEAAGTDSEVIRKRSGHTNVATTRGYMHAGLDSQKGAARLLQRQFG